MDTSYFRNISTEEEYNEYKRRLYSEYLLTPGWAEIARKRREIDNNKCCLCGSEKKLIVHHLTYKNVDLDNPGSESINSDLMTLCKDCHFKFHEAKNIFDTSFKKLEEEFILLARKKLKDSFEEFYGKVGLLAIEANRLYENKKIPQAKYEAKSKLRKNLINSFDEFHESRINVLNVHILDIGGTIKRSRPIIK